MQIDRRRCAAWYPTFSLSHCFCIAEDMAPCRERHCGSFRQQMGMSNLTTRCSWSTFSGMCASRLRFRHWTLLLPSWFCLTWSNQCDVRSRSNSLGIQCDVYSMLGFFCLLMGVLLVALISCLSTIFLTKHVLWAASFLFACSDQCWTCLILPGILADQGHETHFYLCLDVVSGSHFSSHAEDPFEVHTHQLLCTPMLH